MSERHLFVCVTSSLTRHLTHMPFHSSLRCQEIQEVQQLKGSRARDEVSLDHFWADAKRLTICNNPRDAVWSKRILLLTQERTLPPPPIDFLEPSKLGSSIRANGVADAENLQSKIYTPQVSALTRLVEFIDIAVSIDPALVSSTHREGM